jgi:hypothetical protein
MAAGLEVLVMKRAAPCDTALCGKNSLSSGRTPVNFQNATRNDISRSGNLHSNGHGNLKSRISPIFLTALTIYTTMSINISLQYILFLQYNFLP